MKNYFLFILLFGFLITGCKPTALLTKTPKNKELPKADRHVSLPTETLDQVSTLTFNYRGVMKKFCVSGDHTDLFFNDDGNSHHLSFHFGIDSLNIEYAIQHFINDTFCVETIFPKGFIPIQRIYEINSLLNIDVTTLRGVFNADSTVIMWNIHSTETTNSDYSLFRHVWRTGAQARQITKSIGGLSDITLWPEWVLIPRDETDGDDDDQMEVQSIKVVDNTTKNTMYTITKQK